ncbi:glycoside hydrolase family 9 protein [Saccharophagus sp. K07]|uniref:glycoside hydrolase family 9 protein n=1 Tax=Saccharophagus sp. K07 TaxID=2283636 RepID=UPI001CA31866|nr:glycoside hydrolase family 9 protein [Saccharophagus sp. K07]
MTVFRMISKRFTRQAGAFRLASHLVTKCLVMGVASCLAVAQAEATTVKIHLNQIGFLPEANKVAVVPNTVGGEFWLVDAKTGRELLRGPLSQAQSWDVAGETVKIADFTAFNKPGHYKVKVAEVGESPEFYIQENIYDPLLAAAIKYYYYNRSGAPIEKEYAGQFARPAGHPDTIAYIHPSAASNQRPAGTVVASAKGWYDAGDYNKYVVNSGITTYTLLAALADFPRLFADVRLNIPESTNAVPDLLDEIMWNLDWFATMQDPHDGGVYHKLTDLAFSGDGMPHVQNSRRFLLQKSTAAALNYAAVMAYASVVLRDYEKHFPGRSAAYLQAAQVAWNWAKKNPKVLYIQPADVSTGTYAKADEDLQDEWLWAAVELFRASGKKTFLNDVKLPAKPRVPEWDAVETLGLYTLATYSKIPAKLQQDAKQLLIDMANRMVREYWASGYLVAMTEEDYRWGSNAVALNKAMVLLTANRVSPNKDYEPAARGLLDYVLGRNPTGYNFVTGFGYKSPKHPHHRLSQYDGVVPPVPGMLAGGPHSGWQDKCKYPSRLPAKSYLDDWCSYSTNEVAINWNAPLVYVLAALRE